MRWAIALDPDRLGLVAGSLCAAGVLAASLFWRHAEVSEAVVRAGIVLVVAYTATFLLVLVIQRVTFAEVARQRQAEREQEQERVLRQKADSDASSGGIE